MVLVLCNYHHCLHGDDGRIKARARGSEAPPTQSPRERVPPSSFPIRPPPPPPPPPTSPSPPPPCQTDHIEINNPQHHIQAQAPSLFAEPSRDPPRRTRPASNPAPYQVFVFFTTFLKPSSAISAVQFALWSLWRSAARSARQINSIKDSGKCWEIFLQKKE